MGPQTIIIQENFKMRSRLLPFSLCVFTILLGVGFSAAADLESAKRAYNQRDCATAVKESLFWLVILR